MGSKWWVCGVRSEFCNFHVLDVFWLGSGFTGRKSMRIALLGRVLCGDAKYGLKSSGLWGNFLFMTIWM